MPVNCVIHGCKSNGYSKNNKENQSHIAFHRRVTYPLLETKQLSTGFIIYFLLTLLYIYNIINILN